MKVKPLLNKLNTDGFLSDWLIANGIKGQDVERYLHPDDGCFEASNCYPNVKQAAELLQRPLCDKRKIGLLVDVDCDGFCSATLVRTFLNNRYNVDPVIYIRKGKEHGLRASANEDICAQIVADDIGLLIVPDGGTNDRDECKYLEQHGCHVLILDHHKVEVDNPYAVIVNHHLSKDLKLNTALSGTGVTAKFIEYYCRHFDMPVPYMSDLVAMSLFSDSCDMTALENRAYADVGMARVDNSFLKELQPTMVDRYGITPTGYSWAIIPLINAVCREEETADKYRLFDAFCGKAAADDVIKMCRAAHRLQTNTVKDAVDEIEPTLDTEHKVIIGFTDAELANQIGLIANKFMSKYRKPIILLREANSTTWSGSLRSPVPMADIINASGLAKAIGHDQACGVILKKSNLNKLIAYLDNADFPLEPEIEVAACIEPDDVTISLCSVCQGNAELWGQGLREPSFYINVVITQDCVQVFKKRTNTIKITVNGVEFLLFMAKGEQVDSLTFDGKKRVEMIVTLSTNEWNGVVKPQGKIKQVEVSDVKDDKVELDWESIFN